MVLNPYFEQGSKSEQSLVQSLINEQLKIYGVDVHYMPRKYVSSDSILREVSASSFEDAYPIEAYIDNFDGYGDNPAPANMADVCPTIFGTSTKDKLGCPDTDGDGWSDDADDFDFDDTQWNDSDSDGYGDNPSPANYPDDCIDIWGNSTLDNEFVSQIFVLTTHVSNTHLTLQTNREL